ncbi:MAG TPA: 6-phosphogluconolactonase [Tepidisphaeraceae bacterium]|nr:6-phosphogluconolactonase [Tepidisphaeraceae bacterium]
MIPPQIKVFPDLNAIAGDAANRIVELAARTIASFGKFSIVLSGGNTPRTLYELLATEEFRDQIDWARVQIFFGDERCVPPDHADSNFRMAQLALLSKIPVPGDNIYRIRGEIDPNEAAIEYGRMLKERFGEGGADLTLLGMGPDGHTASLFPHTEALKETKHRCVPNYVPKFESWRVTITVPFINKSGQVLILAAGADKAQALRDVLEGPPRPDHLPIQMIAPASGAMTWLIDISAAEMEK